ncbi:MAG: methyltransferase domain-containing protein [Akkermansiaceae bacterium]|nr:methyltransferase domain-containing protein [Akkermansiaceae bacterium]
MTSKNSTALAFWEKRYREDPALGSGVGSKGYWKRRKLDILSEAIRRHGVTSVLDLGCGDMQVLSDLPELEQLDYIGVDFSEEVLAKNRERFPGKTFIHSDLDSLETLDVPPCDLIVCFDVLFHIESDETYRKLCHFFFNSGARAAAITYAVGRHDSNNTQMWYRDFDEEMSGLPFAYVDRHLAPFRLDCERLAVFDLARPGSGEPVTEIAYVATPDRFGQLDMSLRTLVESGSGFDRVSVFVPRGCEGQLSAEDRRISVRPFDSLIADYPFADKAQICNLRSERVVFLDTDTFLLRPLDRIWRRSDRPFMARPAAIYGRVLWNAEIWAALRDRFGSTDVPMFNSGFVIFQQYAHRKIAEDWIEIMRLFRAGELEMPNDDSRCPDQWGLALAIGKNSVPYEEMNPSEHAFGFKEEDPEGAVVYHSGHDRYAEIRRFLVEQCAVGGLPAPGLRYPEYKEPVPLSRRLKEALPGPARSALSKAARKIGLRS